MYILFFISCYLSLNIVIHSGYGGRSHIKNVLEISNILVDRGHKITYLGLEDNLAYIQPYNISTYSLGPKFNDKSKITYQMKLTIMDKTASKNPMKAMKHSVFPMLQLTYLKTYLPLKKYLINNEVDLMICDFIASACIDLAKQLSIPLIVTMQTTDGLGVTHSPYVINSLEYGPIYTNELKFIDRFKALIFNPIKDIISVYPLIEGLNKIRNKYKVKNTYTVFGDGDNYAMVLANTFTGFEPAVKLSPNLFQIGPILDSNVQPLSKDLNQFINDKNKVLYIAFGSLSQLNIEITTNILHLIYKLLNDELIDSVVWSLGNTQPTDFPVTFRGEKIRTMVTNNNHNKIKFYKWVSQTALLQQTSMKLFISHCGLESSFEAMASGIPLLCLPLFGDQFRNARKLQDMNIAGYINKDIMQLNGIMKQVRYLLFDTKVNNSLLKVKNMVTILSKRKMLAADLIEQHATTAKICRQVYPFKDGVPCELKHLIPKTNYSIFSIWNIDVYLFAILVLVASMFISVYYIIALIFFSKGVKVKK